MAPQLLARSFYLNSDVVTLSQTLVGKVLVSKINGLKTSGIITETEAYKAPLDKASHAYNNRRTARTETLFAAGGIAYVYLCYGIHHLFNVVTGPQDTAHAILIRNIKPLSGIEHMKDRRGYNKQLVSGPATLTQAMGITIDNNREDLLGDVIWIEDHGIVPEKIISMPRVGIDYAEEYVHMPWRFIFG